MKDAHIGGDRDCEGSAGQSLRKVLYDLDESLKGIFQSAEVTASCEAFRRSMQDIDENVRRLSKLRNL